MGTVESRSGAQERAQQFHDEGHDEAEGQGDGEGPRPDQDGGAAGEDEEEDAQSLGGLGAQVDGHAVGEASEGKRGRYAGE